MHIYKIFSATAAFVILFLIIAYANPALLAEELVKSDSRYVLLALAVSTFSAFFRVLKWSVLINVGVRKLFPIQMLGMTISNFTPGKIAEPAKALILKMRYGTDVSKILPSIIWERVNDLLVIIALAVIAIQMLTLEKNLLYIGYVSIGIFAALVALFIIVLKDEKSGKKLFRLLGRFPLLNRITESFVETFYKDKTGKKSILLSLVITVIPWILDGYVFYFSLLAVGLEAEPVKLAGIIALSVLIGVLSSLPGGIGSFEVVSIMMLGIIGLSGTKAIAGLMLYRLLSIWYVAFLGWLSFVYLSRRLDIKNILKKV